MLVVSGVVLAILRLLFAASFGLSFGKSGRLPGWLVFLNRLSSSMFWIGVVAGFTFGAALTFIVLQAIYKEATNKRNSFIVRGTIVGIGILLLLFAGFWYVFRVREI